MPQNCLLPSSQQRRRKSDLKAYGWSSRENCLFITTPYKTDSIFGRFTANENVSSNEQTTKQEHHPHISCLPRLTVSPLFLIHMHLSPSSLCQQSCFLTYFPLTPFIAAVVVSFYCLRSALIQRCHQYHWELTPVLCWVCWSQLQPHPTWAQPLVSSLRPP